MCKSIGINSQYEVLAKGQGCKGGMHVKENECEIAAKKLGFHGDTIAVQDHNAPYGCFVGHPIDDWKHTFFNQVGGKAGNANYKSICKTVKGEYSSSNLEKIFQLHFSAIESL